MSAGQLFTQAVPSFLNLQSLPSQPLGPRVFSGPLQPFLQFSLHSLHSPLSLYLPVGHSSTQFAPSLLYWQAKHESAPGPVQPSIQYPWHADAGTNWRDGL